MRYAALITALILLAALVGGCASKYVPVPQSKLATPRECKARHYSDLPKVPTMNGPSVSPEEVNKHWARHHRLKSRPAYRRLYRDYRVCSAYARGS